MAAIHMIIAVVLSLLLGAKSQDDAATPCNSPPIVLNANFTPTALSPGSIVTYYCLPGYQPRGSLQKSCRNGIWIASGPELVCDAHMCPSPGVVAKSFQSLNRPGRNYIVGVVVTYNCYSGYLLNNSTDGTITCLANRTWTTPLPTCEQKDCGHPPIIAGGNMSFGTTGYPSSVSYWCNAGYSLYNNGYLQRGNRIAVRCLSSGIWGSTPECRPKDCGLPANIDNGIRLSRGNHLYGQEVAYECNHGFMPRLNSTTTCLAYGRWSILPECIKVVCESPPTVGNATSSTIGKAHFGNTTTYTCSRGFEMYGPSRVTCQADGTWSQIPTCVAVNCRTPPSIHFGTHTWTSTTYNSVTEYKCDEGYKIIGVAKIFCDQDGRWMEAPSCEMPPVPPGGAASKSRQVSEASSKTPNSAALTGLAIACALFGVVALLCIIAVLYKVFVADRKGKPFSYASYKNGDDSVNGI